MKHILRIHPADTVAVALQPLHTGETLEVDGISIQLQCDIPAGHKVALVDIPAGANVIKYGCTIGHTLAPVAAGMLVDHDLLATNLSGEEDYSRVVPTPQSHPIMEAGGTFLGYLRPDGQVGIRNDIWVIPTVGCVNGICQKIVAQATRQLSALEGSGAPSHCTLSINCFPHNYGCSQLGDDHENTRLILRAMVRHPNAGGVLVVGLGCENNQPDAFRECCGDYDPERVRFLTCQQVEGDELEEGVRLLLQLYEHAARQSRSSQPLSQLRVGLKCGGSDGFSGITANPLVGRFSDWLCGQGGTTVLTEVPEMFGAETLLMRRSATPEVLQQIIELVNGFKRYYIRHGQPVGENPSPGNKAGGISTLEEKALGCTQKAGTATVCGVLAYGETFPDALRRGDAGRGLHLLCAPGNDLVASTALAAIGCQLILFTTGRGTPFASFVPTLKVATNSGIFQSKPHWMDFDAGRIVSQSESFEEALDRLVSLVLAVANGQPTRAEEADIHDMAIWKNGVTL